MSSSPVLLLLGSGPRIGAAVAKKFAGSGYRVATVSRKGTGSKTSEGYLSLQGDLTKPESIPSLFTQVQKELGAPPTVVVYNAGFNVTPAEPGNIFTIPAEGLESDLRGNVVTPYVVAQEAVKGWASLPAGAKKTFIFTGNGLNDILMPVPGMASLAVGKSAVARWIAIADLTKPVDNARFFYADERFADGNVKGMQVDGDAHADFYSKLAEHEAGVPWQATFVKDKGYVKF